MCVLRRSFPKENKKRVAGNSCALSVDLCTSIFFCIYLDHLFHKPLPRSSASVNWFSVRFYHLSICVSYLIICIYPSLYICLCICAYYLFMHLSIHLCILSYYMHPSVSAIYLYLSILCIYLYLSLFCASTYLCLSICASYTSTYLSALCICVTYLSVHLSKAVYLSVCLLSEVCTSGDRS